MERLTYLVIGGDLRQKHLAGLLANEGHSVYTLALDESPEGTELLPSMEKAAEMDCIVLPLPAVKEDGYIHAPLSGTVVSGDELFSALRPGQMVVGGKLPPYLYETAGRRGIRLYDYLEREEMAVRNAVPSVEGAVEIALSEVPITLHGAKVLVIGFGRIGKLLARILQAFGSETSVSARKYADFAWIESLGYRKLHTGDLAGKLSEFDIVFNTVPQMVLPEGLLAELKPGCLVIDLASKPGGLDFEAAAKLGVRAIWALSLPGKTAPLTSGEIIKDTISNILDEWGVT